MKTVLEMRYNMFIYFLNHSMVAKTTPNSNVTSPNSPVLITPKVHKVLTIIAALSFIAMGVTAYLTYLHFEPTASDFCNFSDQWNCDIVNKSEWSVINLGFVEIPVAIMGFGTYLFLFLGSLGVVKKWRFQKIHSWFRPGHVINVMRYFTYIGVVFTLYLTYIETFKLQTYCIFCVIQQILILIIAVLFVTINVWVQKTKREGKVCEFC